MREKILVIGACGQIGVELTLALRKIYGSANVFASDLRKENDLLKGTGPYISLDVMNKKMVHAEINRQKITQIYLLAAILSATGEKKPDLAWTLNMQSLMHVLEIAKEEKVRRIFWPSSIAVFGHGSPKINCPQQTVAEPLTVYGISKCAGELWCKYYDHRFQVDVRSLRYPGLISYKSAPGGGTTDYAIEIFHEAIGKNQYTCFLKDDTVLPMMYMPDAIRATIELMESPVNKISVRTSYNISGMSFSPKQIAQEIKKHLPGFTISYQPDYRLQIAQSWPESIDDSVARSDWGWKPKYDLPSLTMDMIVNIKKTYSKYSSKSR